MKKFTIHIRSWGEEREVEADFYQPELGVYNFYVMGLSNNENDLVASFPINETSFVQQKK